MSNKMNQPSARGLRHFPGQETYAPFSVKVTVGTEDIPLRTVDEFLKFLTAVYGSKIRITQNNAQTTNFILYLHDRTDVGLRVASWLYGFQYQIARLYN